MTGEGFKLGEDTERFEYFCIEFQRRRRRETTGAAARLFLGVPRMRRRIGAEKQFGGTAFDKLQQGILVHVAFEHGQTVEVRTYAARQQVIAVVEQMLHGDSGGHVFGSGFDKLHGFTRGDVFKHDAQFGEALT